MYPTFKERDFPPPQVVVVWSLSCVYLFATPWTVACQAFLSLTISWSLLKLMSIAPVMLCYHFIFSHPCLFLPSFFPSIRVFSNELILCIRWSEYLELQHQLFQLIFRVNFLESKSFDGDLCLTGIHS